MRNMEVKAISLAVAACFSSAVSAQSNWQGGYAGLSADLLNTSVNNGCVHQPPVLIIALCQIIV